MTCEKQSSLCAPAASTPSTGDVFSGMLKRDNNGAQRRDNPGFVTAKNLSCIPLILTTIGQAVTFLAFSFFRCCCFDPRPIEPVRGETASPPFKTGSNGQHIAACFVCLCVSHMCGRVCLMKLCWQDVFRAKSNGLLNQTSEKH